MPTVRYREASAHDLPTILNILIELELRPEHVMEGKSRYWIAELPSGEMIGVIGMEYTPNAALLRSAGIRPAYQRQGIGERLTFIVISACAEINIPVIYTFSTDAQDYWQRRGFRRVGVDEVVEALPDAPQVHLFRRLGWLPTEVAWRLDLETRDESAESAE